MIVYGYIDKVERVEKEYTVYRIYSDLEACSSCPLSFWCPTSKLFAGFTRRVLVVKGPHGISPGKKVIVDVRQSSSLLEYFFLFGMPVVGLFLGGYFLGGVGALGMMILFFGPAYIYEKTVKEKNLPEVISVIKSEDLLREEGK